MDIEQAVDTYRKKYPVYERFTVKVRNLLDELMHSNDINFTIEHRTKELEHFREKITRPGKSYEDPINEITDLSGLRIVVRQLSDVSKVIEIIRSEFSVDDDNSVYKSAELNVDQFGYTSVHLVVGLNTGRASLTEWRSFKELKSEIQVRTILQHAWAVISHTFDYKVDTDIPREFRRQLFRLSALFELADEELDHLVENIQEKIKDYRASLDVGDTKIELNVDSLRTYIETAPESLYWLEYVRNSLEQPVNRWGDLSKSIRLIEACGLKTIEDIKRPLIDAQGWGKDFFSEHFQELIQIYKRKLRDLDLTKNGIIISLIIAANAERLSDEILEKDLGFMHTSILEAALKARGIHRGF
jgi:putative GTP pyrophosphokinase